MEHRETNFFSKNLSREPRSPYNKQEVSVTVSRYGQPWCRCERVQRRLVATRPKVAVIIQRRSRSGSALSRCSRVADLWISCGVTPHREERGAARWGAEARGGARERTSEGATGYRMWRTGSSKHRYTACNSRRRGGGGGQRAIGSGSSTLWTLVKATTAIDSQDRSGKILRMIEKSLKTWHFSLTFSARLRRIK